MGIIEHVKIAHACSVQAKVKNSFENPCKFSNLIRNSKKST